MPGVPSRGLLPACSLGLLLLAGLLANADDGPRLLRLRTTPAFAAVRGVSGAPHGPVVHRLPGVPQPGPDRCGARDPRSAWQAAAPGLRRAAAPWAAWLAGAAVALATSIAGGWAAPRLGQRPGRQPRPPVSAMAMTGEAAEETELLQRAAREEADRQATQRWDAAYSLRSARTYRDRHYLRRAFPESVAPEVRTDPAAWRPPLSAAPGARAAAADAPPDPELWRGKQLLLEVGCGVGNAALPLLRANPNLFAFCVDSSTTAVAMLRDSPEYDPTRLYAAVHDARQPWPAWLPAGSFDFVTLVFVLSAIDPTHWPAVAGQVAAALRPGGVLYFRDFAVGDAVNAEGRRRRLGPGMWLRQDGTLLRHVTVGEARALFSAAPGSGVGLLVELRLAEGTMTKTNRKVGVTMERRWVEGRWARPEAPAAADRDSLPPLPPGGAPGRTRPPDRKIHRTLPG
eukprot:EG_transcript_12386